jgi:predicted unusual protein kinase regulating ubiquinone biosynthesis (AarF/ABC1/UbiB family)
LEAFIGSLKDEFIYIDPKPIASASIGQVHEGKLKKNNDRVVLKIKRPGIEEQIIDDFETLLFGIGILKNFSNDRKINEFELLFNEY